MKATSIDTKQEYAGLCTLRTVCAGLHGHRAATPPEVMTKSSF